MKILFITSSSINGGAQKHIRDMFRYLSDNGDDVYIVAPKGWLMNELSTYYKEQYFLDASVKNIFKLAAIIKCLKPDIVNTFLLSGGCFGTAAWRISKCGKLIITVNNSVTYFGISIAGKTIFPVLYRWMSKYASAFLTKSDKLCEEIVKVIKKKKPVYSIKNGIDFFEFDKYNIYPDIRSKYGIAAGDIVVTNVAALIERKGHKYLIEAIRRLHEEEIRVHLIIVGDGPYKEKLQNQVNLYKIESYVHFLGRRKDVNAILANSSIFVLCSLNEGLPNSLMEAMSMGLACVATDVGGVRQLIPGPEIGVVVMPGSTEEIFNGIKKVIEKTQYVENVKLNAYSHIKLNYSLENVVKNLIDIYKNICS